MQQKTRHVMCSHLSRTSFEVLLQHAQLDDITGVPDDCHYGDRVAAPDVAVETLGTVKTKRTGHPKPCLQIDKEKHRLSTSCEHLITQKGNGNSCKEQFDVMFVALILQFLW